MKYAYHVAIIDPDTNSLKFLTSVNNQTKYARWEDDQPAKLFTKTAADDMLLGLVCNGHNAVVIKCPPHYDLSN